MPVCVTVKWMMKGEVSFLACSGGCVGSGNPMAEWVTLAGYAYAHQLQASVMEILDLG